MRPYSHSLIGQLELARRHALREQAEKAESKTAAAASGARSANRLGVEALVLQVLDTGARLRLGGIKRALPIHCSDGSINWVLARLVDAGTVIRSNDRPAFYSRKH